MKILLIGEYSNVHWTLAEGLRMLGHDVCVVSNGDFWKGYNCDISLIRSYNKIGGISYLIRAYALLPFFRGYDVVQFINPMFLELKAERILPFYRYIKRHNKKVFLGAFGMDAYWVEACTKKPHMFRYSDFYIGDKPIVNDYTIEQAAGWTDTPKAKLNRIMAEECNGIIAGMYEYFMAYREKHAGKLTYIPFPIEPEVSNIMYYNPNIKIRFFIGIQKERSIYKGTDIMLRAVERIAKDYPDDCEVIKAENVPFKKYSRMVNKCDVLLDQLYGYSPGMNALLAMSKGKVVVGGAEEEFYNLMCENELRPMINVIPDENDVYSKLKWLIENKETIFDMQEDSIEFIRKHHNPIKVAEKYVGFWNSK